VELLQQDLNTYHWTHTHGINSKICLQKQIGCSNYIEWLPSCRQFEETVLGYERFIMVLESKCMKEN